MQEVKEMEWWETALSVCGCFLMGWLHGFFYYTLVREDKQKQQDRHSRVDEEVRT